MESQLARADVAPGGNDARRLGRGGQDGAPMARRLLAAGCTNLAVTEPDSAAREALGRFGAAVAADLFAQTGRDIVFATPPE